MPCALCCWHASPTNVLRNWLRPNARFVFKTKTTSRSVYDVTVHAKVPTRDLSIFLALSGTPLFNDFVKPWEVCPNCHQLYQNTRKLTSQTSLWHSLRGSTKTINRSRLKFLLSSYGLFIAVSSDHKSKRPKKSQREISLLDSREENRANATDAMAALTLPSP